MTLRAVTTAAHRPELPCWLLTGARRVRRRRRRRARRPSWSPPTTAGRCRSRCWRSSRRRPASPSRSQPQGDAGELTNKLVLTKDSPLADGVYGIDNTFASRAVDEGVLAPYAAKALPSSAEAVPAHRATAPTHLTPIDYGDVCVNVDDAWFAEEEARAAEDARRPDQARVQGPVRHPGRDHVLARPRLPARHDRGQGRRLAGLLEAADGQRRQDRPPGWSDAYEVDFTAGGGNGDRPIVLSYSSSPPFTIPEGGTKPTTSALLDTCFRQVEYAGVLKGSENPAGHAEVHRLHARAGLPGRRCRTTCTSTRSTRAVAAARRLGEVRAGRRRSRSPSTPAEITAEPQRVAARVARHHQPVRLRAAAVGAPSALAAVPLAVLAALLRLPGRRACSRAGSGRTAPSTPARCSRCSVARACTGCSGSRSGRPAPRPLRRRWSPGCRSRSCCTGCASPGATCCAPSWWCRSCCRPSSSGSPSAS